MREILFRGKDRDTGEWRFGSLVHQTDYYGNKVDDYFILDGTDTEDYDIGPAYRVIPEAVGQYTGLQDKNGKKIFEGDIVKWIDWAGKEIISVVCYNSEWNRFCVWLNGAESIGVNEHWADNILVIGNIYDNPKLLKENDNG